MNDESFLQIILAKGIGDVTVKRIMEYICEKKISWYDFCNDVLSLREFFNFKEDIVQAIYSQREQAKRILEKLQKSNIKMVCYFDQQYPKRLKTSLGSKSPAFLFYRGDYSILNKLAVGFCGSRKVSPKGMNIASNCAKQLVENGISVVSGYAAGTDISAHKAALHHSGKTVFVLAEGILKAAIKSEIKPLLSEDNHIFVSQYLPESTWNAGNAMKRNSVIIGLSDAMILIESGKKGGTFAAGNETLAARHPLFVIDFAQPEVSAEANPYFISNGGIPIRGKAGVPNISQILSTVQNDASRSQNYLDNKQLQLEIS